MSAHEPEDDAISGIDGSSLFSDGDSEMIDSPADGYFSHRSHPQQLYLQNATARKAQDAPRPPGEQSTTYLSPHPQVWSSEQAPLLDAGPAPPDYYAATTDRQERVQPNEQSRRSDNGYGMQWYGSIADEEQDGRWHTPRVLLQAGLLGALREPQSMGGSQNHNEERHSIQQEMRLEQQAKTRGRRRYIALLMVIVTIICVIVLGLTNSRKSSMTVVGQIRFSRDSANAPKPHLSPSPVPGDESDRDGIPAHPALPGCSYSTISNSWQYEFTNVTNFTFEESLQRLPSGTSFSGSIWIRPASDDQVPDVKVTTSFATSAGLEILDPRPLLTHDSLRLGMPGIQAVSTQISYALCIDVVVAIDVKRGLELEHWTAQSRTFDIFAQSDKSNHLEISDTSTFSTRSGKIDASYWSSRKTIIDTVSGSVHGQYALRDLLSITTRSGSVMVDVDPKEADKDKPVAAVFRAVSESGSVRADFPIKNELPEREYDTDVHSTSGLVSGSYVHGARSSFHSRSGTIVVTLLPFSSKRTSLLTTENVSGSTLLYVQSPYDGGPLKNMTSKHDASRGSGSISLHYPSEWEGSFKGTSTTGNLDVHGPGVEIDWHSDPGFLLGKKVIGRKGTGDSLMEMSTRSGSVDCGFGERDSALFCEEEWRHLLWHDWEDVLMLPRGTAC